VDVRIVSGVDVRIQVTGATKTKKSSDKKLWHEVRNYLGKPARDIKQQLNTIIDRSNKIAHEADIDPTFGIGSRWYIDENLVTNAVNFIEQLVESIHRSIAN
jgi:hypothetical protein